MAAEDNRMAHFKRLVEENSPVKADGSLDLKKGYQHVADLAEVKYDYVYQLYNGKSGKKGIGPTLLKKLSAAFGEGKPENWMDLPVDDSDQSGVAVDRPPVGRRKGDVFKAISPAEQPVFDEMIELFRNMRPSDRGPLLKHMAELAELGKQDRAVYMTEVDRIREAAARTARASATTTSAKNKPKEFDPAVEPQLPVMAPHDKHPDADG